MVSLYSTSLLLIAFICVSSVQAQDCELLQFEGCSEACDEGIAKICVTTGPDGCMHHRIFSCNSVPCDYDDDSVCSGPCGVRASPVAGGKDIPCNQDECTDIPIVNAKGCKADVIVLIDASSKMSMQHHAESKSAVEGLKRLLAGKDIIATLVTYATEAETGDKSKYKGGMAAISNVAKLAVDEVTVRDGYQKILIALGSDPVKLEDMVENCDAHELRAATNADHLVIAFGMEGHNTDLDGASSEGQIPLMAEDFLTFMYARILRLACADPADAAVHDYDGSDVPLVGSNADPADSYCDDMTEWTECSESCGKQGVRTREQTCYSLSNAGNTETITDVFYELCENDCPPATTPATTEPDCNRCDYSTGQFWLQNSQNCHLYYICVKNDRDDGSYYWTYHNGDCGLLYWDQKRLTCTRVPTGVCLDVAGHTIPPEITTPGTLECIYEAMANPANYRLKFGGGEVFHCPDGEEFDDGPLCNCYDPNAPLCDDSMVLYFPFTDHLHDVTCSGAQSEVIGDGEVILVDDSERGSVASFDGAAALKVPFLRNYFKDQGIIGWTMALWIKASSSNDGPVGLMDNGDCIDDPTALIHADFDSSSGTGDAFGAIDTDSSPLVETGDATINAEQWTHVAMVYNGNDVLLYVDGNLEAQAQQSGPISNNQNPLFLGMIGCCGLDLGYFSGLMDDVRVYQRALDDSEILNLYQTTMLP